jgi:hypothetical protein
MSGISRRKAVEALAADLGCRLEQHEDKYVIVGPDGNRFYGDTIQEVSVHLADVADFLKSMDAEAAEA